MPGGGSSVARNQMSGLRLMTDHLDVVSVGVKNEGRVVLTTVLGTQSRRPVVLPAGAQSGDMERVNLVPAFGDERYV